MRRKLGTKAERQVVVEEQDWGVEKRVQYETKDYRDLDPPMRAFVEAVALALGERPEKIEFLLEVPPKNNPWAREAFFRHLDTLPLLPGLKEVVRAQAENSSAPEGMTHLVVIFLQGPGMREVASVFMPIEGGLEEEPEKE